MLKSVLIQFGFDPLIAGWFHNHFSKISPPQEQGWPKIAAGENTLILAPTGSGKTLAAFLWCINKIYKQLRSSEPIKSSVHTLYVSPLKALNNDIERNLRHPIQGIHQLAERQAINLRPITAMVRTGDTPAHVRQSMVKNPPHILITTPESLYLLLTSERGRDIFGGLEYIIIDEIHALCNNKRGVHLSLSLERLDSLIKQNPVRIGLSATQKPLELIAAYLGGQKYEPGRKSWSSRPVNIVDAGHRKKLDLKVISPVAKFDDLPDLSVWPQVIEQIYSLILEHKTTLIFVNMRAQTERIVRQLNDLHQSRINNPDAKIAQPHHGSMSREMRFEVEKKLKNGLIPAVVATASLELGIDIGSIDLVIQLGAPRSVSGSIQRVGRSGHLLSARSKGRIVPLYPADLDDAAALSACVLQGEIEHTTIPENCLDVLAQHIVAELAMQSIHETELYQLCRQSYCFRNLTIDTFRNVLHMLEGKYADSKLPSLQPIIIWDKVNNTITARQGARLNAILNGGTIPDRGYFLVFLSGENTRLGEVEEEFVWESRPGEVFYLGNTEWFIESITNDRIIVQPAHSVKPKAPFWKGEIPYRNYSSSLKIAEFRGELADRLENDTVREWLSSHFPLDDDIISNLIQYFKNQKRLTEKIPSDRHVVAEWFYDSADELNLAVHAPFGGRVTGAWAISTVSILEKRLNSEVQYTFDDDGFLLRVSRSANESDLAKMLILTPDEAEEALIHTIASTPVFAIQFRYSAARALLLPRSRQGKRIPLWLQRLRAADLLQAVHKYPDFPIVLETYRSCLQDVFDLTALKDVLTKVQNEKIRIHHVRTPYPSPMASGLIFKFLTNQIYETDRTRAPGEIANVSSTLLAQILNSEEVPIIVNKEHIRQAESRWQYKNDESRVRDAEDLFLIIDQLGPISSGEIKQKLEKKDIEYFDQLQFAKRISYVGKPYTGWINAEYNSIYANPSNPANAKKIITKFLEYHGPVSSEQIAYELRLSAQLVVKILKNLHEQDIVVRGKLIQNNDAILWCNRNNFAELYRIAIVQRRKSINVVERSDHYRFLFNWHFRHHSILELINQYRGLPFSIDFFEREIIRSRIGIDLAEIRNDMAREFKDGSIILRVFDYTGQICYLNRGEGNYFAFPDSPEVPAKSETEILRFLSENGASFTADMEEGLELNGSEVYNALGRLLRKGLVTCDNYTSVLQILRSEELNTLNVKRRATRSELRKRVRDRVDLQNNRWFLTSAFAVTGKKRTTAQVAEFQARLLLSRYGILTKELYRFEKGLLPWFDIFQVLKRLEWQGEIRRGYFIRGLSGIQFALPEAVAILEEAPDREHSTDSTALISTADPLLPFGGNISWELDAPAANVPSITRSPLNHLIFVGEKPVIYCENFGLRLWCLSEFRLNLAENIAAALKVWLKLPEPVRPRKKIEISLIDGKAAADSEITPHFVRQGYEIDAKKLVLWPSAL